MMDHVHSSFGLAVLVFLIVARVRNPEAKRSKGTCTYKVRHIVGKVVYRLFGPQRNVAIAITAKVRVYLYDNTRK